MPTFQITDCFGEQVTLQPRLGLYSVTDFMGQEMPGLAIILDRLGSTPEETEQYAVLTTSFGEFIGAKDCAYIDTNNCYFASQLLEQGFAENTGLTKCSGFCQYPLWHFKEDFLREIGGERQMFMHDLRSKDIFESPCFYLQQNDIVYVEPKYNKKDNEERGWQIGTTLLSVVTAVCSIIWATK